MNRWDSINALRCCGFTRQTSNAQRTTSNIEYERRMKPAMHDSVSGEHRLPACSIRQLAECTSCLRNVLRSEVRGRLPQTAGWQPALPRTQGDLTMNERSFIFCCYAPTPA